ncbi:MAG TPA: hypothetical protein VKV40_23860 [Ktedonobacteraceae bacterium]|nr:hypothetical protein [Ktedonobacteraceae bacterium]
MLAVALFIVTGVLVYLAFRLRHPVEVKRPGKFVGVLLVVILMVSVLAFLVAAGTYALALTQQEGHIIEPGDPITPVTLASAALAFFVIIAMSGRSSFRVAVGSAIVGTIAAPMIFELPFDLIVMGHTYPPTPGALFTLLFFLPLFLIELTSFAMLALSPLMRLSRYTLFCLAGMFLIFAVWAWFGFAYPLAPLPIVLNMISKVLAFATAVSLFLPLVNKSVSPSQGGALDEATISAL